MVHITSVTFASVMRTFYGASTRCFSFSTIYAAYLASR